MASPQVGPLTQLGECLWVGVLPGEQEGSGTQGGLHHAAGGAEDDTGAGGYTHGVVQALLPEREGIILSARSMRTNSRVVSTRSTSGPCSVAMVGSSHSAFLATQGMMDTQQIFSGSTPSFWANQLLATLPNICCGLLAVDSCPVS